MPAFSVYIPVGPSPLDIERLPDLIDSLVFYEPEVALITLIDHGPATRRFREIKKRYPDRTITVVRFGGQTHNGSWLGAGCTGNLLALKHIASVAPSHFVLKLDLDALIIAPFSQSIEKEFNLEPKLGIIGTLGNSSNLEIRTLRYNQASLFGYRGMQAAAEAILSGRPLDNAQIVHWNLFTRRQRESLLEVARETQEAEFNGFIGQHCQGGAYALSPSMLMEMQSQGLLENVLKWFWIPIAEDRMMGLYCSVVNCVTADFCGPGQPFGVQAGGLPYSPEQLIQRGHSVIHSLRNNSEYTEEELRNFFRARRQR